jgi:peptidoglycan/xylan/chitin deacetylase (PgdA/CDA1 family)
VRRISHADGALGLTFDDGPDPRWTPRVLDALERAGARASFFVMARSAAAQPELVSRMCRAGHRVELHCARHVRHRVAGRDAIEADLREGLALLAGIGVRPRLWRLPWGEAAGWSAELAGAHGLALCRWSADTRDWRGDRAEAMLAAVAPLAVPGAVVLMHDGLGPGALRPGCGQTVALIGPLAELARSRGLALEPLREPSC